MSMKFYTFEHEHSVVFDAIKVIQFEFNGLAKY